MSLSHFSCLVFFFFFNDTATTEIYTLSLHDALPIRPAQQFRSLGVGIEDLAARREHQSGCGQRAEQLQIQPALRLERAQELRRARLRRELLVHRPEGEDEMILRTAGDPDLPHRARDLGRSRGREERAGLAVGQYVS